MKSALLASVFCALTTLAPATLAEETPAAQAKKLFSFGVRAYEAGQYRNALTAFEKAHALSPHPAILFSCAQALRRQWTLDHRLDDLQKAIGYYRRYVAEMKQAGNDGGRLAEAAAALEELEPLAAKLGGGDPGVVEPTPEPTPEVQAHALIMVSSSVKSAKATLDGKPVRMPLSEQVTPGKHVVRISARGYVAWEREVQVGAGGSFADDAILVARRARLSITAPAGAEVLLDGRSMGEFPLLAPIDADAGDHRVAIVRDGYHPWVDDLYLERGEKRALDVSLSPTGQRITSYVFFGAGLVGLGVGTVLAGVAFNAQNTAQEIDDQRAAGNISEDQRIEYEEAVARRDEYRRAAFIGLGAGGLLGAVGFVLFLADSPDFEAVRTKDDSPSDDDEPSAEPPALEMTGAPGAEIGVGLRVSF
jgi:tetratricopeptide (TPR) repeat protein